MCSKGLKGGWACTRVMSRVAALFATQVHFLIHYCMVLNVMSTDMEPITVSVREWF